MIITVDLHVEEKETVPGEAGPWRPDDAASVVARLRDVLFDATKHDEQVAWMVRDIDIRGIS